MAKAKKKKAAKKPQKKNSSKPRAPKPRAAVLPGMDHLRIKELDDICESIAETREAINDAKREETDFERAAFKLMKKHKRTTWKSSGVELYVVPGEEKLRVKTSRAKATGEVDDEEAETVEMPEPTHETADTPEAAAAQTETVDPPNMSRTDDDPPF